MKRNGPIWEAVKRGGRVAYHGYRRRRLEGKLARAREAEAVAWRNPTGIPGRVLEVRYARGGRDRGRYVHHYGPNVRMRLGPGRSRVTLYHARGEPIWADERGRDFDKWVDLDHHRRRMNPSRGHLRWRLHRLPAGTKACRICGRPIPGGRVASLCNRCLRRMGYKVNPRRRAMAHRRRRRSRRSGGSISTQTWLLLGVGAYLWYSGALTQLLGAARPSSVPTPLAAGAPAGP